MADDDARVQPAGPEFSSRSTLPPENNAFFGPNGLRAGWRLLIAAAIFFILTRAVSFALARFTHTPPGRVFSAFTPRGVLTGEALAFGIYLATAWIMSGIEGRRFRDYGLGPSGAFAGGFWVSAAIGFGSISLLLASLHLAGVFHLGEQALGGAPALKDGALWALAFLFVGFLEEDLFRGYILFTLTTGIWFWPAAIVTSILFGAVHLGNTGESYVGAAAAGGIGFLFCILTRKTGNLWAAVGFHMAWDWGETYFYGVPDSGLVASGHLFTAKFAGPVWLTGGSVGPEGSWLCLILIVLLCVAAAFIPGKKYPNPDAIRDPRRRRAEPAPSLLPETPSRFSET
ncbi:MAG TPA: CPBP family intramembrane glutamic endopeptidase [Candidatus Aquilonibacter sp.]|nr:CPBP family intramembrane glutamic endopeptidase [Candidatus Aquilonibacter sp.]